MEGGQETKGLPLPPGASSGCNVKNIWIFDLLEDDYHYSEETKKKKKTERKKKKKMAECESTSWSVTYHEFTTI